MIQVAIIVGSTRPGRKAEIVAHWIYDIASKRSDAEFEVVDSLDFNLPLLDEPCRRRAVSTLSRTPRRGAPRSTPSMRSSL